MTFPLFPLQGVFYSNGSLQRKSTLKQPQSVATISNIFQPNSSTCAEMGSPLPIIFVYQAVASMHTRHIHACPGNAGVSMDSRLHQKLPELLFNWSCGLLMSPELVQLSNKASTNSVRCASCHGVLKLPKDTPSHYGLRMLRSALWYKNQVWVWGVEVCFT